MQSNSFGKTMSLQEAEILLVLGGVAVGIFAVYEFFNTGVGSDVDKLIDKAFDEIKESGGDYYRGLQCDLYGYYDDKDGKRIDCTKKRNGFICGPGGDNLVTYNPDNKEFFVCGDKVSLSPRCRTWLAKMLSFYPGARIILGDRVLYIQVWDTLGNQVGIWDVKADKIDKELLPAKYINPPEKTNDCSDFRKSNKDFLYRSCKGKLTLLATKWIDNQYSQLRTVVMDNSGDFILGHANNHIVSKFSIKLDKEVGLHDNSTYFANPNI